MALFSRKSKASDAKDDQVTADAALVANPDTQATGQEGNLSADIAAGVLGPVSPAVAQYQELINRGEAGPFDLTQGATQPASVVAAIAADERIKLDFGSFALYVKPEWDLQVDMTAQGPQMMHLLTPYGRLTPVAFATPTSERLWPRLTHEAIDGMQAQGLNVRLEQGPWNREVVGTNVPKQETVSVGEDPQGTHSESQAPEPVAGSVHIRIIGVEGHRWLLRLSVAAPYEFAEQVQELSYELLSQAEVLRGEQPLPAGSSLALTLPDHVRDAIVAAMQQASETIEPGQDYVLTIPCSHLPYPFGEVPDEVINPPVEADEDPADSAIQGTDGIADAGAGANAPVAGSWRETHPDQAYPGQPFLSEERPFDVRAFVAMREYLHRKDEERDAQAEN